MICELCGKTVNEGFKVRIEGGLVSSCAGCAGHGEVVEAVRPAPKAKKAPQPSEAAKVQLDAPGELEVVEGFGARIKAAREKQGLTQEELGRMVNEPHSVIHRMEMGRMEPSVEAARRLEHRLGIRILAVHEEPQEEKAGGASKEITLGDMVVVRKRGK
jgi:putative transcription factor